MTTASVPAPPLPRAWLAVGLLWFVAAFNYLDRIMLTSMHASIVSAIPMSDKQFALLTSAFLWVYALLSPFAGFLADRFSRSRVIVASMVVWSAVTLLTAYARTFEQLLCMRALMGISEACYLPAALALITDYHRGTTRSLAVGIHMTGINVGSALSGLGGWLAEDHGWPHPFKVFGAIGIGYGVLLIVFLRDTQRESAALNLPTARFGPGVASLFRRPPYLFALGFWGLIGFVGWLLNGWMPTYFFEHFHLRQGQSGFLSIGTGQGASLLGFLFGGALSDWAARRHPRGRILVPAFGMLCAAPGLFLLASAPVLGLAMLGLAFYGFFKSFLDPNVMPILCLVADPRYRATGYGIINMFSCIVGGIAVFAGGALRDSGLGLAQMLDGAGVIAVVCAVLIFLVRPAPDAA